ncbi:MAG: hypothetical protein VYC38_00940 [Pseudomonadota bacterium]|nr:hypothetical protein [Pseudomonadota bacterium]
MRLCGILVAAGLLAACGQERADEPVEAPAPLEEEAVSGLGSTLEEEPAPLPADDVDYQALSGYDDSWYVSAGWPGEYPAGFAVLDAGVTVPAWSVPNSAQAADTSCALPQYANYQLWNSDRVAADGLRFFVATKTFPVTLNQDASIEYISDGDIRQLDLKAGDQLTYLRYLGEGFTVVSFEGTEYGINEAELRDISDIGAMPTVEDQWVRVSCTGGDQAWLLYAAVIDQAGIVPSPMIGYGEAWDIAPEDADQVRADAEANRLAYEGLEPGSLE